MYPILIGLAIVIGIVWFIASAAIAVAKPIGITFLVGGAGWLIYQIYLYLYFNGNKFKKIKDSIKEYTKNCNELNHHIEELKGSYSDVKTHDYGDGDLYDNSNYKFKRKEWSNSVKNNKTHNCSASICKSASEQPFKYLCKYFDIKVSEETLSGFESVLNDFAAAEQGKVLLRMEREKILASVSKSIPFLIFQFSKKKLIEKLGFENIDLSDLYFPVYTFQYVSSGGNSSSKCDIKLNVENLDKFVIYLNELVKFRKSAAGQRALMTSSLREKIKERDSYACKYCSLSIRDEKNLLLEIDHVIPLAKGGITSEDNLQTLCWKCNRSKGSKVVENVHSA